MNYLAYDQRPCCRSAASTAGRWCDHRQAASCVGLTLAGYRSPCGLRSAQQLKAHSPPQPLSPDSSKSATSLGIPPGSTIKTGRAWRIRVRFMNQPRRDAGRPIWVADPYRRPAGPGRQWRRRCLRVRPAAPRGPWPHMARAFAGGCRFTPGPHQQAVCVHPGIGGGIARFVQTGEGRGLLRWASVRCTKGFTNGFGETSSPS